MQTDPTRVAFYGYWAGEVPAVAELHFRSFLHQHPQARYELWLDEDHASRIAAPELQWIARHPRIAVRPFSLDALIEKHVSRRPVPRGDPFARLRRLGRALHRGVAPRWARQNAWEHPVFGLTYKHSSRLFAGFHANRTYRGDLARCLIALEHYPQPCIHAELDVAFAADLTHHCGDKAWAYRWETHGFASSAVLYLPSRSWSTALVRRGNELENFLPWILFSDAVCAELGIAVQPARLFDPLWDSTSLLYGDAERFFRRRDSLALDLHALAGERHLAIHWHGHWQARPHPNSIYAGLLKACGVDTP